MQPIPFKSRTKSNGNVHFTLYASELPEAGHYTLTGCGYIIGGYTLAGTDVLIGSENLESEDSAPDAMEEIARRAGVTDYKVEAAQ